MKYAGILIVLTLAVAACDSGRPMPAAGKPKIDLPESTAEATPRNAAADRFDYKNFLKASEASNFEARTLPAGREIEVSREGELGFKFLVGGEVEILLLVYNTSGEAQSRYEAMVGEEASYANLAKSRGMTREFEPKGSCGLGSQSALFRYTNTRPPTGKVTILVQKGNYVVKYLYGDDIGKFGTLDDFEQKARKGAQYFVGKL